MILQDIQAAKQVVRDHHRRLDAAPVEGIGDALQAAVTSDYVWRGYHPFGLMPLLEVTNRFWKPLRTALTAMQRRQDIFFAGRNQIDDFQSIWVVSMGHLMGLFDKPWLGIRPTGKMAFLRYCEFNRVDDGKLAETSFYFDIPHLMAQAGQSPFGPQTAAHLVQPGPQTHTGLLYDPQDPKEGAATLALINAMITDLGQWQGSLPLEDELRRTWHEDMIWWGPEGIGATYTIERYARQHSGPFRAGFADRSKTGHLCRLAEGEFGGFFGWPNFTARPTGGFMGMPASQKSGEFRVIDIYRRAGDKLAENWVFIDLLHFWNQQGVDLLARTTGLETPWSQDW